MEGERRLLLGELALRGAVRWRGKEGCVWGSSRCAGLFDGGEEEAAIGGAPAARGCSMEGERRLLLGELPLRGAVRWRGKGGCFWGSFRCAGLFDMEGGTRLLLGELPLRGAVRWREKGGCFWGSSRCAGLFDRGGEEAASGGAPAARGYCSIEGGRRLFLGELPLRGAARLREAGGGCFWRGG